MGFWQVEVWESSSRISDWRLSPSLHKIITKGSPGLTFVKIYAPGLITLRDADPGIRGWFSLINDEVGLCERSTSNACQTSTPLLMLMYIPKRSTPLSESCSNKSSWVCFQLILCCSHRIYTRVVNFQLQLRTFQMFKPWLGGIAYCGPQPNAGHLYPSSLGWVSMVGPKSLLHPCCQGIGGNGDLLWHLPGGAIWLYSGSCHLLPRKCFYSPSLRCGL